jgi:hypothetical protein
LTDVLVVVELLDGRWLGLDVRGADWSVERELETWALVADQESSATIRSDASWDDVVDAGPLLDAVSSRRLNDTARRVFPGVTRHLDAWWGADHEALSAGDVARRIQQAANDARAGPATGDVFCTPPRPQADGSWRAEVDAGVVAICAVDGLYVLLSGDPAQPRHWTPVPLTADRREDRPVGRAAALRDSGQLRAAQRFDRGVTLA